MDKKLTICAYINALLVAILSAYLFISPVFILMIDLGDDGLSTGAIPHFAFHWHQNLSHDFETWANQRVEFGKAKELSVSDIAQTEWPMFSSVFYLWATESLQEAWELDPSFSPTMPKEYARGAIEAAGDLISDPNHAAWVKVHWGKDYLKRENLFYRMLLISGLTSYQKLLGDGKYQQILSEQVESLSNEIDRSPYGLLDDYPNQCYPIDILPAIAAIRRADAVLMTDHSEFVTRAIRAFEGVRLDGETGLPAYIADSKTGMGSGPARGVGISYMLIWSPELWPETTSRWYAQYKQYFWQPGWLMVGVREFPRDSKLPYAEWFLRDVDAGPVLAGYGTTASAFGIGATRANGRFDQAYPLSAEALATAWPLPDGTLLAPRLLSYYSDAPFVGETILLFTFTRRPIAGISITSGGKLPVIVYLIILLYIGIGIVFVGSGVDAIKRWQKYLLIIDMHKSEWGLVAWITVCTIGVLSTFIIHPLLGLLILLLAQMLPKILVQKQSIIC